MGSGASDGPPPPPAVGANEPGRKRSRWLPYLVLLVLTVAVWGRTLGYGFVWDDECFIVNLKSIRSLSHVPEMFTSLAAQSSYPKGFVLFRPLRTVQYALLYQLGGGDEPKAWLFHLANVLWHAAAVLLLFSVTQKWFRWREDPAPSGANAASAPISADWLAFWVAAAFAVHPVVTEVVCWAKSLDDIMAMVFVLAAFRPLLDTPLTPRRYGLSLCWFVLAVYSKASAVPFAIFAGLFFWVVRRDSFPRSSGRAAGFVAVALVFLAHSHWVVGRTSQAAPLSGGYGQTLVDMFPVALTYLRLFCGLPPFMADYSYLTGGQSWHAPSVIAGAGLLVGLVALIFFLLIHKNRHYVLAGLGSAWAALFMLPYTNLVPMMQYLAERFTYLPLIGWLIALAAGLVLVPRRLVGLTVAGGMLVLWTIFTWQRTEVWQDNLTLYVRTALDSPVRVKRMEDNALVAALQLPHMEPVFHQQPTVPGTLPQIAPQQPANPAQVNWPAIFKTLEQLHRWFPANYDIINCVGFAWVFSGRPDQAGEWFQKAVQLDPLSAAAWNNLGKSRLDSGQLEPARTAFQKALEIQTNHVGALQGLAAIAQIRQEQTNSTVVPK